MKKENTQNTRKNSILFFNNEKNFQKFPSGIVPLEMNK